MRALLSLAVLLVLAGMAHGAPYVAAEGGLGVWPATSNGDQLEADSGSGVVVGLAAGIAGRLGRLEIEVAHRASKIHGFNRANGYCRQADGVCGTRLSGDGNTLHTTSVTINAWPGLALGEWLEVYAGGGLGGAYLEAIHDQALNPLCRQARDCC